MIARPYAQVAISTRRRLRQVYGPVCLPITAADMQPQLGIRSNLASNESHDRIRAATELIEKHLNRAIVAQTWDMWIDDDTEPFAFPLARSARAIGGNYYIDLVKPPTLGIVGIYMSDDWGVETTVDPLSYSLARSGDPSRIALIPGFAWPYHRPFEGFRIRFVAGYVQPFKAEAGTLTAPNHAFIGSEYVRISRGLNEQVPQGSFVDTDYQVTNVSGNTLQLLDMDGQLAADIDTTSQGGWAFLGEIPEPIRREIVITAASGLMDQPEAGRPAIDRRQQPIALMEGAMDRLKYYKHITI